MKINLDFNVNQEVYIKPLSLSGRVIGIYIDSSGTEYKVRYFDKADAKEIYFLSDELSIDIPQKETKIGL